jgi:putative component of toxin-antitoxin plasmid stabilization module
MSTFHRSDEFDAWLASLKDKMSRARIALRIRSAEHGNFGDCEPVGEGVSEMRIHFGPAIASISPGVVSCSICFCWAATSPRRSAT